MLIQSFFLLILPNFIGAILNLADVECGLNMAKVGRVVGGIGAADSEIPWAASLWRLRVHQCGATIISDRWLLTAGHCVCSSFNKFYSSKQLTAVVGSYDLSDKLNTKLETLSKIVPHPNYKCERTENDVALLETNKMMVWSKALRPACLPQPNTNSFTGYGAMVAGWGWTEEDRGKGERPNILHKVELVVVGNDQCSLWYQSRGKNINIADTQMCAGFEDGGRDACWADSGGPLIINDDDGRSFVAGVVSTGHGCARRRLPGIYTRVSKYIPWIENIVKSDNIEKSLGRKWRIYI